MSWATSGTVPRAVGGRATPFERVPRLDTVAGSSLLDSGPGQRHT